MSADNRQSRPLTGADELVLANAEDNGIAVWRRATDTEEVELDPSAAVAIPAEHEAVGIGFQGGWLTAAFPRLPGPADLDALETIVGTVVHPAVALGDAYRTLRNRAEALRGQDLPAVERILEEAIRADASDVHVATGTPPSLRIAGALEAMHNVGPMSAGQVDEFAAYLGAPATDGLEGEVDMAANYGGRRLRVNAYRQRGRAALAVRLLPADPPRLDELGLPDAVSALAGRHSGLVLFCGPTGSGKSTSLAALIAAINATRSCHILTIEDPVEYLHRNDQAVVHQREIGVDTDGFAPALRGALRQDPDVILVGEMRDPETIAIALAAASTGHLVFSTLHAHDAESAIQRTIGQFPESRHSQVRTELAAVIEAVVCQQLVPDTDHPDQRHVVCEVLLAADAVRNQIRTGTTEQLRTVLQSSIEMGMQPFELGFARAVAAGHIANAAAENRVADVDAYRVYLQRADGRAGGPASGDGASSGRQLRRSLG